MKFLIDTNIFIPLEPVTPSDEEKLTNQTNEFVRLAALAGHQVYLHPKSREDIENDRDEIRKFSRISFFSKYPLIPTPPEIAENILKRFGAPKNSHDAVDFSLISAVQADAVDYLVTEDKGIHTKALSLGLKDRVFNLNGAVYFLNSFFPKQAKPLPEVQYSRVHTLDEKDPIFDSLRADYNPGFDSWLTSCKRGHRECWVIKDRAADRIAGLCIIKHESETEETRQHGLFGKILKLCTFKVSEEHSGKRLGELLLKAAFQYAHENKYDWIFVTVLPKHQRSVTFFEDFGFEISEASRDTSEFFLTKPMWPSREAIEDSLSFHVKYGPYHVDCNRDVYLVPIRPVFHDLLFPELNKTPGLFDGAQPFGNSIRKAYVSGSQIKSLTPGAVLMFYRSGDVKRITTIGVVENTKITDNPDLLARFVGKRTVYEYKEIERFCKSNALAILFRQAFSLDNPIDLKEIINQGYLGGPPQSITKLSEAAKKCILKHIKV